MIDGFVLWGLAPLAWGMAALVAVRLLGRERPGGLPAVAERRDLFRRAA